MKAACMLVLLLAGCSPMLYTHGVPNLDTVDPDILRGGEPTMQGWHYLYAEGVRTVVKLNFEDEASDAYAESLGIRVLRFEMPPGHIGDLMSGPTIDVLHEIVTAIQAALSDGLVYFHCEHGQDRTGLVAMAIRVWRDGWTWQAAYAEALAHHFHRDLLGLRRVANEMRR